MTAIRTSLAFAFESQFRGGLPENGKYLAAPPNSFFTHGHQRSTNRQNTMGTKKFDYIAYGSYHGTWSWSFTADYHYLEPLLAVFEDYKVETIEEDPDKEGSKITGYKHTFRKVDAGRVPTMCFRRVQLNKQAGGENGDEVLYISGAVCTDFNISVNAGQSQVNVSMSGFSAEEYVEIKQLSHTDFKEYDGEHVNFACLFTSDTPSEDSYVGNVQALRVTVKNNAERIWSTCGPIMGGYYEGVSNYEVTANIYSTNPLFRNRLYTGGRAPVTGETTSAVIDGKTVTYVPSVRCKKLAPMESMCITSYSGCAGVGKTLIDAMKVSPFRMDINISDVVFKSMSWERGESSMLMDNLSSAECRSVEFTIFTDATVSSYKNPANDRYISTDDTA